MSTAMPGCSFSTVHRIQTYKRWTLRTEQLSFLAIMQAYRHTVMDTKSAVWEFCAKKKVFFLIVITSWQE